MPLPPPETQEFTEHITLLESQTRQELEQSQQQMQEIKLLLEDKDDFRSAEPLVRRALAIQEKALGPQHPETAVTLNNLASLLLAGGKITMAEATQRRALRILEHNLSPENPRIATARANLADILRAKASARPARQ